MKQKDWALIILIAVVAGIFALAISNLLISSPKNRQEKVEIVDPITDQFDEPNPKYFNAQSIDPTKLIEIGDNANPTPFGAQ